MIKKDILYSLPDITILPSRISDIKSRKECQINYPGLTGEDGYIPVVTAPMDSVVDENNYQEFINQGISPIIPRTVQRYKRLELCKNVFCAFGLQEVREIFLDSTPKGERFYILIDIANGHMKYQLETGKELKEKYGSKIILMGGNIANPDTVWDYQRYGFDFVRCGVGGGKGCLTTVHASIHYPLASLISDIDDLGDNRTIKIIADGGIRTYSDAIKCLALGADYVMMGFALSKSLEAAGDIYTEDGKPISQDEARELWGKIDIFKEYHGMSTKEAQAKILGISLEENRGKLKTSEGRRERTKIEYTLEGWTKNLKDYLKSSMSYTGFRDIKNFIGGPVCQVISDSTRELLKK